METVLFMPAKNKIYKMNKIDNCIKVTFGQVGSMMHHKTFPLSEWDSIYDEKISLGYIDQTDLYDDSHVITSKQAVLSLDEKLNAALTRLRSISRQMVSDNYELSKIEITSKMIETAENIIAEMQQITNIAEFNSRLFELFSVIPRKMKNVILNTARNSNDFEKILEREKDLLQNLTANQCGEEISTNVTYETCTEAEIVNIKSMLDSDTARKFRNVWKITNHTCEQNFQKYLKENKIEKTKLLFHGSRSENWWSIIQTKLMKKPTNVVYSGSMFGSGIYFANKAAKSAGYTSILNSGWANGTDHIAYLGIYEVAYGNPLDIHVWNNNHLLLSEDKMKKEHPGRNCVHAHAGQSLLNDEIIIYNENACSIRYLIEIGV